jgi:hypothetical protein
MSGRLGFVSSSCGPGEEEHGAGEPELELPEPQNKSRRLVEFSVVTEVPCGYYATGNPAIMMKGPK